ncbi:hypothetical protein ES703_49263 [subsurface metagenome]
MKRFRNLKIFGLVAILTVSLVFIGVDFIESQVKTQGKPEKPFKPGKPEKEWIQFTGELEGGQVVEGCCPNAGPFPEYTMTLKFGSSIFPPFFPPGTYDGQLFINSYGAGRNRKYKVQFWWNYDLDLGIEIIGGVIEGDKKTKVLTVTFTNEECVHIKSGTPIALVSFELVRHQYSPPDS